MTERVPAIAVRRPAETPAQALDIHEFPSGEGRKARVLIIEENLLLGKLMQRLLTFKKYNAWVRAHSSEGVSFAKIIKPEVVLVNLDKPSVRGLATCKALRDSLEMARCAIVVMSNYPSAPFGAAAYRAGATMYVQKPLLAVQLAAVVEDAISR